MKGFWSPSSLSVKITMRSQEARRIRCLELEDELCLGRLCQAVTWGEKPGGRLKIIENRCFFVFFLIFFPFRRHVFSSFFIVFHRFSSSFSISKWTFRTAAEATKAREKLEMRYSREALSVDLRVDEDRQNEALSTVEIGRKCQEMRWKCMEMQRFKWFFWRYSLDEGVFVRWKSSGICCRRVLSGWCLSWSRCRLLGKK